MDVNKRFIRASQPPGNFKYILIDWYSNGIENLHIVNLFQNRNDAISTVARHFSSILNIKGQKAFDQEIMQRARYFGFSHNDTGFVLGYKDKFGEYAEDRIYWNELKYKEENAQDYVNSLFKRKRTDKNGRKRRNY